jgi:hypothetical protein
MLRKDIFAVILVTVYLFIYITLLQFESTQQYGLFMLPLSPFLIGWMVYTVLKHGKFDGPELGNDEFGYQDKRKEDLGVF